MTNSFDVLIVLYRDTTTSLRRT